MARKKTKRAPASGDLEALAFLLGGAFLFFAASLWPPEPLSGELGRALKTALQGTIGWAAWLLPLPFLYGTYAALRRLPLRRVLRKIAFGTFATLALLPLSYPLAPKWAGEVGKTLYRLVYDSLGPLGLLIPAGLALVFLELFVGTRPLSSLRALGRGLFRLGRALFGALERRSERGRLRSQARELLAEVRGLLSRYPEHRLLADLEADLKALVRRPKGERLLELKALLEALQGDLAEELAEKIAAEVPEWTEELRREAELLKKPLKPGKNPLLRELEARRRALALELKTLHSKAEALEKEAKRAGGRLPEHLNAEQKAFEARQKRWQALEKDWLDLKARLSHWWAWRAWAESAPAEAIEAGAKRLAEAGLTEPPPQPEAGPTPAEEKAPPEPTPAPRPRPKPKAPPPAPSGLSLPPLDLLDPPEKPKKDPKALEAEAAERAEIINQTLAQFGLKAKVVAWARGPTVTRYEIEPAPGEKIARIQSLANDLARALAVGVVRIEAPIPGKSVIGLEVPNAERELVRFSEAIRDESYQKTRAKLPLILGKSIEGQFWVRDLAKMPHLLIAGSTGSGKSVAINALVMSLLFKYLPTELRLLMIDPKMVELTPYDGIPHLVRGVVTDPADAAGVLQGAVAHMERRYKMMSKVGVRSLEQYNKKMKELGEPTLPYLVIVIDELADLMITSPKEVEQAILRLAQMARATGMHLILATQRPSVDILTSLIKVNIPARIAFAVSSSHDSRTILDATGAERLTGQGDMLFYQPGLAKPVRLQGPFLSDAEIHRVTGYLRPQTFEDTFVEKYGADFDGPGLFTPSGAPTAAAQGGRLDFSDPLLEEAARIVVEEGQGSVSRLQRRLSVGHARAGKLMDLLEAMGIVGPHQGSKPREVLISADQLEEFFGRDEA